MSILRSQAWVRLSCIIFFIAALAACGSDETSSSNQSNSNNETDAGSDMSGDAQAGECPDECNDQDACTSDSCVDGVCEHVYDAELCCTSDQCEIDGACYDNGAANPENTCEICLVVTAADGWTADASVTTCDDGDPCTMNDSCVAGECVGSTFECDDDNPCTDDVCDGVGGCMFENNTASCEDGDLCTTDDVCSDGACVAGATASCDDGNGCTVDSCDPTTGCMHTPDDGATCDDGDVCSTSSVCQAGECVPDVLDDCDDADVCTIDFCDSENGGCGHNDISDLCADTNPCTDESCDPDEGCVFDFNTDSCDDNSLCTVMDTCSMGSCVGTPVDPDDGNLCTDDSCNPATGVMNVPNTLPCDDNDACTVGDTCAGGGCQPGTQPLNCDDNDVCTMDSCDSASGCVNTDISSTCDDGNACTIDSCDAVNGCANTVIQSFTCRPDIVVSYPPRAATIQDSLGSVVTVTGSVSSGAGPITTFTINGQAVTPDPVTGAFTFDMTPAVGSNVLVFEAIDSLGTEDFRVQSYHWSTDYTQPVSGMTPTGVVNPGLGIYLDQQSIDDGQAPPPTDLAAIFEGVLNGFDLSSFFDPNTPIASESGYDIYLTSLGFAGSDVGLQAIDGGLAVTASLNQIDGDLFFDCTTGAFSTCWLAGGDSTGGLTIDSIVITADLVFSVDANNELVVTVQNANTTINNLNIFSDNWWTNFLLSIVEGAIIGGVVSDLETELNMQLSTVLGPLLEDGLGALAFNQSFDLPRLDGSTPGITVNLESDFAATDFRDATPGPQGGSFDLRAWATAAARGVPPGNPYDANQGVPMRVGCGTPPQELIIPRAAPLEIVFSDDSINQILRGAWWGGLLEFPVGASLLGGVDLASFGVTNLTIDVSGQLPPIATDCASGQLILYIGDLELTASMDLFGQPLDAVIYTSFEAPISLGANPATGDIEITVQSVQNVELEVNVVQESMLASQPALKSLLETELVPALGGLLGNGQPLASFPLPAIDLSASLGQPPGTSVIAIQPISGGGLPPSRQSGNTVIYGQLQ